MSPQASKIVVELRKFVGKEVAKLVLNVHKELTTITPRDTSWAANNWIPSLTSPSRSTIGSRESVGEAASGSQAALATVVGTIVVSTDLNDVYISNNVPYIRSLNDGHSKKAPAGFVQIAVQAGLDKSL